eukprot:2065942-Amphidinium_carterae.1
MSILSATTRAWAEGSETDFEIFGGPQPGPIGGREDGQAISETDRNCDPKHLPKHLTYENIKGSAH